MELVLSSLMAMLAIGVEEDRIVLVVLVVACCWASKVKRLSLRIDYEKDD